MSYLITAIGTPLDDEENLREEGLALHLDDQWQAGIHGILVAGSMGLMQMLRERTYEIPGSFARATGSKRFPSFRLTGSSAWRLISFVSRKTK
jgi:dihydrodipicolinate synthase/N-acetylneuraminate lyase